MIVYIDTSALARAYLRDQDDGDALAALVHDGADPVVTSELTDVEIASAFARAKREGVVSRSAAIRLLDTYRADTSDSGPIGVIPLTSDTMALAQQFVGRTTVRSLDAIHLAACAGFAAATSDQVELLSRDERQLTAARALGLRIRR